MERNRRIVLLGLLALLSGACRSWDELRTDFVDPVNLRLHSEYPRAWKTMALDDILAFYSPGLAADPAFRKGKEEFLARFRNIEHAAYILDQVEMLDGGERLRSTTIFKLWGEAPGEARLAVEQTCSIVCERVDGTWRISEEAVLQEDQVTSRSVSYSEESESRGLKFVHSSQGVVDRHGKKLDYSAGSGLAVGDHDGDGHEDIYLVAGTGGRLFRSNGDGTFMDRTAEAGLDVRFAGEGRFAVFADYDSDGHTDLFVGLLESPNLLFRNRGDNTFEEVAARAGLGPPYEAVGAAFADFNRDGHLDLYIVNGSNLFRRHPEPIYNALNAVPNALYVSNGDGTFTDRTREAGVGHSGWGLAVTTADYDLDGDTDIFVGNDVGFNVLYRNRGDGTFDDVTQEAGIIYRGSTMSVAWSDLDGDGYPDLFAPAMDSNSRWMTRQPGFPSPAPWFVNLFLRGIVLDILNEMLYGNRLYMNNRDGTFREVADTARVRRNGWAWSGNFLDYDNDGDQDIYCCNGFVSGPQRKDL